MNAPVTTLNTPLSPAQAERLDALVRELGQAQLQWLSGYLAARAELGGGPPAALAAPSQSQASLTVLHGSQSGNGAKLARRLAELAQARGLPVTLASMADYKPARLRDERLLALIVSTHGEGEPPDSARELHEFLHGRKAPRLEQLRYSVLALGDSSYEFYCQTGKDFDAVLEKLGAQRLAAAGGLRCRLRRCGGGLDRHPAGRGERRRSAGGDRLSAAGRDRRRGRSTTSAIPTRPRCWRTST